MKAEGPVRRGTLCLAQGKGGWDAGYGIRDTGYGVRDWDGGYGVRDGGRREGRVGVGVGVEDGCRVSKPWKWRGFRFPNLGKCGGRGPLCFQSGYALMREGRGDSTNGGGIGRLK